MGIYCLWSAVAMYGYPVTWPLEHQGNFQLPSESLAPGRQISQTVVESPPPKKIWKPKNKQTTKKNHYPSSLHEGLSSFLWFSYRCITVYLLRLARLTRWKIYEKTSPNLVVHQHCFSNCFAETKSSRSVLVLWAGVNTPRAGVGVGVVGLCVFLRYSRDIIWKKFRHVGVSLSFCLKYFDTLDGSWMFQCCFVDFGCCCFGFCWGPVLG